MFVTDSKQEASVATVVIAAVGASFEAVEAIVEAREEGEVVLENLEVLEEREAAGVVLVLVQGEDRSKSS